LSLVSKFISVSSKLAHLFTLAVKSRVRVDHLSRGPIEAKATNSANFILEPIHADSHDEETQKT